MPFKVNPITGKLDLVNAGTVTNVTASSPLSSSGGSTPNLTIQQSSVSLDGYLSASDFTVFNNKQNALTLPLSIANGGTGQSTANSAFNALAPSQTGNAGLFLTTDGSNTSWGSIPLSSMPSASSTTLVTTTSASTTFVTAITTTITVTASSATIWAKGVLDMTSATAASVANMRITINAVAGGTVSESLTTATTQHLTLTNQALSASLGPGTYTINCQFARASGTGTVTVGQGSLIATVLQGGNSNGITQITGLGLSVGPGSGAQTLTGVLSVAGGGTNLSSTTINQILYSSANNVIAGLPTANTGALVTSSTGVPSITSGSTANRLLRTNGTTVSFAQANLTTDVTGTLPVANGGTGLTAAFAAGRVMFSNGTTLAADPLFQFTTANTRFFVGQGGGTGRINGTVSLTDPTPGDVAGNFFSRTTTNSCVNIQNENTLPTIDMTNSGGTTVGANILAEASRGTLAARTQSQVGDTLFSITAHGRTASAYSAGFAATISIVTTDTVTDTTNGGEIVLLTTPNSGTTPVERLRIKNSGESVFANAIALAQYTTTAKNALTPSPGWVVYDTTLNQLSYYNGTTWINL